MSTLDQTVRSFFEWYRAVTFPQMQHTVETVLDTREKKLAYALTAPDRGSRVIANLVDRALPEDEDGPSRRTVSDWQVQWVRAGLMRQISDRKREPIFDLEEDFGIDLGVKLETLVNDDGTE